MTAPVPAEPNPPGLQLKTLLPWLLTHVPGLRAPLRVTRLAGGQSNLTYRVSGADSRGARGAYVLRRPPLGDVPSTAHDVLREARILQALARSAVPVPPVIAACADVAVTGAPFFVTSFVPGHALNDASPPGLRRRVGRNLVDALAQVHLVDVEAVGLGGLRRPGTYLDRQLARWHQQYTTSALVRVPQIDRVHAELVARRPEPAAQTLVHGDFRLENCLVGDDGAVLAVLDWELAAVGDPLADLGLFLAYWRPPAHLTALPGTSGADGFPTRQEIVEAYAARTGQRAEEIDYYIAFGYWKLACVLSGVHVRASRGATGERYVDLTGVHAQIAMLADAAAATLAGGPVAATVGEGA